MRLLYLILLLLLFFVVKAEAVTKQTGRWNPSGLDFMITTYSGELSLPDLATFIGHARNPGLFAFHPEEARHLTDNAEMEANGILLRFRFSNPNHPRYDYWAGFGNLFSEVSLFTFVPASEDSLKIRLVSQTSYFTVSGGVNRHYLFRNRFGFTIGMQAQFGLNVGGRILQEFLPDPEPDSESVLPLNETHRLFSKDGPIYSISCMLGLRVRLFSRTFLSWEAHPSYWISRIDGSTIRGTAGGGSLGIEMRFEL